MLFNSYDFIFGLLPLTLLAHHWALGKSPLAAARVLVVTSLIFYGWWYWPYLLLLIASILVNFKLGVMVADPARSDLVRRRLLQAGIVANLSVLAWFKYLGWIGDSLGGLIGVDLHAPHYDLPIGVSFYTFTQIAWLVDARRGISHEKDLTNYSLFVSFFPHLIAGPIVHHGELMPQFEVGKQPTWTDRSLGLTFFAVGLAKKLLIADQLVPFVDGMFGRVHTGALNPTFFDAWHGILAWHFQLYFDFSGYSDMAIGLALLFGIRLPINFEAPYRCSSIIDFWRRWHLTLTRFLRDYLYVPLGGNKVSEPRYLLNQFLTIFIAGIWHGAGWTYLLWGAQMGIYQVINAWWLQRGWGFADTRLSRAIWIPLTWLLLTFSWPLFRGQSAADAWVIVKAMAGFGTAGVGAAKPWLWAAFAVCTAIVWFVPTIQQWTRNYEPAFGWRPVDKATWAPEWEWRPTLGWAAVIGGLLVLTIPVLDRANAFLYWNF